MTSPLSEAALARFESFACDLARLAARETLPRFQASVETVNKAAPGQFDPVTAADRGAEAAIRSHIAAHFPDHGVIGEEYGEDRPDAEFVWVLDPVDGTRAFISGLPLWTTLIALRYQGAPVVGVIAQPCLDEIFAGTRLGATRHRRGDSSPIRVRACADLTQALIATTDPYLFTPAELGAFNQVRDTVRLCRFGCDAYAYAMVASGHMDMVIENYLLKSWDIEAAIPLLEGAGGLVTDWRGQPIGPQGGQMVISANRTILDQALVALRRSAL